MLLFYFVKCNLFVENCKNDFLDLIKKFKQRISQYK